MKPILATKDGINQLKVEPELINKLKDTKEAIDKVMNQTNWNWQYLNTLYKDKT